MNDYRNIKMFERVIELTEKPSAGESITALSLFRLLSDIMEANAEHIGAGKAYHDARNLLWVLLEYDVDIHRLPKRGERVRVGTRPYSFWKVYGYRIYRIRDENGDILATAKGKFTLIDTVKRRIVRPDEDMLSRFKDAIQKPLKLDFDAEPASEGEPLFTTEAIIEECHLDVNDHVNNAEYVGIAETALSRFAKIVLEPRSIRVWYKRETKLGDVLSLIGRRADNGVMVEMFKDDDLHARVFIAGFFYA